MAVGNHSKPHYSTKGFFDVNPNHCAYWDSHRTAAQLHMLCAGENVVGMIGFQRDQDMFGLNHRGTLLQELPPSDHQ